MAQDFDNQTHVLRRFFACTKKSKRKSRCCCYHRIIVMSCGTDSPIVRRRLKEKQVPGAQYIAWRDRSVRSRRGESDASWSDAGDHDGLWNQTENPGDEGGQGPNEGRVVPLRGGDLATRGLSVVRPRHLRRATVIANGTPDPEDALTQEERRSRSADPVRPAPSGTGAPDGRGGSGAGGAGGGGPRR